jgi:hypothetical protein
MTTLDTALPRFRVIHPLDDIAEAKHTPDGLGRIVMTRPVKWSLFALRSYLFVMVLLVFYRFAELGGIVG